MFRPYALIVRAPGAPLSLLASFLGSLPISMLTLGVLLLVHATTSSFGSAGLASGALSAGNACGLLVQGRLIDRYGQTRVLVGTGLGCTTLLILLTLAATRHAPVALVVALAGAGGACIPATISSMRVLWPTLVRRTDELETAYALLAMQFHIAMITGPLVVSGLLLFAGPSVAVLAAAGLAGSSALVFASTRASRRWRSSGVRSQPRPTGRATSGTRTLLVAGLLGGTAFGLISVAIPATAVDHGAPAVAGVLFACVSAGELAGGTLYGGRSWRIPRSRRLLLAQATGTGGVVAVTVVAATQPVVLMIVLVIFGALYAPAGIAASSLLDDVAAEGALTQAYTSMVAAGLVGASLGSAFGGLLENATASWMLFAAAACAMAAAALWTVVRRHSLTRAATAGHAAGASHAAASDAAP
ncbi:MFS transporter [Actinopolymorpha sp. B9G3]|uniref:MFS transporter n=1 Tax=Actinopolymorpha sp. B9G3 TaxID=3158970 RepID=UPI0032D8D55C